MNTSGAIPPVTLTQKIAYGVGSVAYGIKNNGYDYFLLMFYSVVLGVDARLVGVALFIALTFDAISDPLVGYFSDNLRSRWGRRHPFMYAAALPVAVCYFLLWNPDRSWSESQLVIYLILLSILIRTLITFYETPSSALAPELTKNYHERTSLLSFRYFFGWTGGNCMSVLMFGVLLVSTAEFPDGRFNLDGWNVYGFVASIGIFIAIMASALGTHSRIPYLKILPPNKEPFTVRKVFTELYQTISDKSFFAILTASLFSAVATGVTASLVFTILSFFWGFTPTQIFIFASMVFVSAALAFVIAPMISKRINKKRATILLGILAFGAAPLPVLLRLIDVLPQNGEPWLFLMITAFNTLDVALIIAMSIVFASMVADLVEESEVKTGRRSEGVFFASVTFIRKCTQGIGVLIAGFILEAVNFPKQTSVEDIPADVIFNLGLYYVPTIWILWSAMLIAIGFYRIDKTRHEDNLRKLTFKAKTVGAG